MTVTGQLRTKRIFAPASAEDGTRILVALYPPRGARLWDYHDTALAPSKDLLHEAIRNRFSAAFWPEYRERFLAEMAAPRALDRLLEIGLDLVAGKTITLLCHCVREDLCHRGLLRELLEGRK